MTNASAGAVIQSHAGYRRARRSSARQHNEAVFLDEFGLEEGEYDRLREERII